MGDSVDSCPRLREGDVPSREWVTFLRGNDGRFAADLACLVD